MQKGPGSYEPGPFPPLTGYELEVVRRLTVVSVSGEVLGRVTAEAARHPAEDYRTTRRGARESLARVPPAGHPDVGLACFPGTAYRHMRCLFGGAIRLMAVFPKLADDHSGHDLVDPHDG